jgi:hypothetical protein
MYLILNGESEHITNTGNLSTSTNCNKYKSVSLESNSSLIGNSSHFFWVFMRTLNEISWEFLYEITDTNIRSILSYPSLFERFVHICEMTHFCYLAASGVLALANYYEVEGIDTVFRVAKRIYKGGNPLTFSHSHIVIDY